MGEAPAPGRLFRTVRHLRPRQIVSRLRRAIVPVGFDASPAPPRRAADATHARPIARRDGWIEPRRVRLLNREQEYGESIDWSPPDEPDLWTCTLHSFTDLPGTVESGDRPWMPGIVADWIVANPPGASWAWNTYATSRRVVNWILWILADPDVPEGFERSLATQIRHVARTLEVHLMANHLLANACALVAGGLFFDGPEAERWLEAGFGILDREIPEQVLADGGHFERSPMYQGVIAEDLLDLLNLGRVFPAALGGAGAETFASIADAAERMLGWLATMIHTDGEIAFFNDATLGVAPTYGELCQYSEALGVPVDVPSLGRVTNLAESGYVRLASADARTLAFFDAGAIGPDYQPGHSHCDTLSLEVSRNGRRILVNSGTSTYERGEERLRERRTAAHTTVRIDGAEQSEVWASHRCGRRARPIDVAVGENWAQAAHDGYRQLAGGPMHRRRVAVLDDRVVIRDAVEGAGEHLVEWFFHLHPGIDVAIDGGQATLSAGGSPIGLLRFPEGLELRAVAGEWHPGFYLSRRNVAIVASTRARLPADVEVVLAFETDEPSGA